MKKFVFSAMFVMGLAAPALAQAHPCDTPPVAGANVKSPFVVQYCWSGKDDDGVTPTTATSVKVLLDGVVAKTVPPPVAVGAPSAAGLNLYQVTGVAAAKGTHTVSVVVTTADGDAAPSPAYSFSVVGKPAPASGTRVTQ